MISIGIGTFMAIMTVVGILVAWLGDYVDDNVEGSSEGWVVLKVVASIAAAVGFIGLVTVAVDADFLAARLEGLVQTFPFLR